METVKENNGPATFLFSLDAIGYTDLTGQYIRLDFDPRQFGNTLYQIAPTIQVDDAARAIFSTGRVEAEAETLLIIAELIEHQSPYLRRVKEAVREYINNLIKEEK